jgi:outer membrane protein assembly factor BamB
MGKRSATLVSPLLPAVLLTWLAASGAGALGDDWPGWRGPGRDGVCRETNLLRRWPEEGPSLLWKAEGLGEGYSAPSVVGDRAYTMGNRHGKEWVLALDVSQDGREVWAFEIGPVRHQGGGYPGPRATPTIDGELLFTLGCAGDLVCLDRTNGQLVWRRDLVKDFGGRIPNWAYSESVLVDGKAVVCTPGSEKSAIVSIDKRLGEEIWRSDFGLAAGYSSLIKCTISNVTQYVTLLDGAVVGVESSTGRLLWRWNRPSGNNRVKIPTCVTLGKTVFAAAGYDTGSGLIWARRSGDEFTADELYFDGSFGGHEGGFVRVGYHLYGSNNRGELMCLDYRTGELLWQSREPGHCAILYANGMLYCRDQRGPMTLVEATPEDYRQRGRFEQPSRTDKRAWPHPVIANGRLYLRDQHILLCYDLRAEDR